MFEVEIKEASNGPGQFDFVSARVKPIEVLQDHLAPGIYNDLINEVRGEAERKRQSIREGVSIVGSMVMSVMCWNGGECVRQVAPIGVGADLAKKVASWAFQTNWEENLRVSVTDFRYFRAPDRSTHAVLREQLDGLEKGKKRKSGSSA